MPFRLHAKKVGLTYSCPVAVEDNPIESNEVLCVFLEALVGTCNYIIGEEKHTSGKRHYHVYLNCDNKIDTINPLYFDYPVPDQPPVHPNIIRAPGAGWVTYCKKDKDFITNINPGNWVYALSLGDADQALEHLWKTQAADMCKNGDRIEMNVRKRMKTNHAGSTVFHGPYPEHYYPKEWNPTTHSLLLVGPPGVGKTQFAKYLLGDYDYVKRAPEQLKKLTFDKPFIFDEVNMNKAEPDDSREITDVMDGGTIHARYGDVTIPPGVKRVFISNYNFPFLNPNQSVYGRRVHTHSLS